MDKDVNIIESSWKDIEGINGETAWIIITDDQTQMIHADTRLIK